MRYALIEGKLTEVICASPISPWAAKGITCPYFYNDGANNCELADRSFSEEENWLIDAPEWCPLPSEAPGTGAEYLTLMDCGGQA